ncbi:hypothetical protein HK097_001752 [Rhizophlyctis rosea]|uniref:cellulase n=1 Tax=Rhizophlyctis rosea TaxID=64517 RepID=A0AAD5S5K0_9FUNG|nr:hypothetical protein HK097_001752 [Rhizophlyctis rosea]
MLTHKLPLILAAAGAAKAAIIYTGTNEAGLEFGSSEFPGQYNKHFINPDPTTVPFWKEAGLNIYRVGFQWERAQPAQGGALNETYLAYLDQFIDAATGAGQYVMLEPHNYARYYGKIVGSDIPNSALTDFWTKMATRYKSNRLVQFDLMNEPHTMPVAQWFSAAQASITAIRATGFKNTLYVPGIAWTGAHSWVSSGNSAGAGVISDPENNWAYDMHQYFDTDYSGTNKVCSHGVEVFTAATSWLRANGKKAFLGEFATTTDASCDGLIDKIVAYLEANSDVWIGWAWWAAGPWWGDYMFNIEPSVTAPQRDVLKKYFVGNKTPITTTTTSRATTTSTTRSTTTTRTTSAGTGCATLTVTAAGATVTVNGPPVTGEYMAFSN